MKKKARAPHKKKIRNMEPEQKHIASLRDATRRATQQSLIFRENLNKRTKFGRAHDGMEWVGVG